MDIVSKIIDEMVYYYEGDPKRIHHFLKVYGFAKSIGQLEQLDEQTQLVLEVSAVVHDIGIKISEKKYNSSAGKFQEIEGPAVAKTMLNNLGFEKSFVERVCYLIGHHHTYTDIDGVDYQILVEADFLVNILEDDFSTDMSQSVYNKVFKTETGKRFYRNIYK